jgi:hypothetical protein
VNVLHGAVVKDAYRDDDGCLVLYLAHRGTDDDACTVTVEPDEIDFEWPVAGSGESGAAGEDKPA